MRYIAVQVSNKLLAEDVQNEQMIHLIVDTEGTSGGYPAKVAIARAVSSVSETVDALNASVSS